jgi:radical SAM/Cys-rich protein
LGAGRLAAYASFQGETLQIRSSFADVLNEQGIVLTRRPLTALQVNIGKKCNQACHHCHVEAGPNRTEMMARDTMAHILHLLASAPEVQLVDITGGAPELHADFRYFVEGIRALGREVIDRCNLTVLWEPGQEDTARFLAENRVQVVASLPCYSLANVEKQRGKGVFDKSIRALQLLNELGYGDPTSGLVLNLVYNPGGPSLPPSQEKLKADYQRELGELFDIRFNELFTITNMPIKRFLHEIERDGKYEAYMELLANSFNPRAAESVMCRDLVSVGWDGSVYDCDFNQMLEMPIGGRPTNIREVQSLSEFAALPIAVGNHCFGCTAGAGSSCGGAIA